MCDVKNGRTTPRDGARNRAKPASQLRSSHDAPAASNLRPQNRGHRLQASIVTLNRVPRSNRCAPGESRASTARRPGCSPGQSGIASLRLSNNRPDTPCHATSAKPCSFIQLQPFACWNNRKFGNARMTASVNSYEFDSNALQSIPITEALPYLIPTKYWVELADIAVVD
jgi:hypothetical protein